MRNLIYIIAILWVAAFVWQTIAHAENSLSPVPVQSQGDSLMELWPESPNGG